jgi:hypothetical protein
MITRDLTGSDGHECALRWGRLKHQVDQSGVIFALNVQLNGRMMRRQVRCKRQDIIKSYMSLIEAWVDGDAVCSRRDA